MKSLKTRAIDRGQDFFKALEYMLWLVLDPSKFTIIKKEKIKKAIIIHLGAIGELVGSTPMFSALKKGLDCEVSAMVRKGNEQVLENNPNLCEVLTYKPNFWENVEELKKRNFDLAVIVFPGSTKIAYMCIKAEIPYRLGCNKGIKDGLALGYTRRTFPVDRGNKLLPICYMKILGKIGVKSEGLRPEIFLSKKEKDKAKKFLKKRKINNFAMIHPGFSEITKVKYPSRLWPLERYAEIADYFMERYKLKVLLTGSKKEEGVLNEIKKRIKPKNLKKIFVCPDFSVIENAAIVNNAKIILEPHSCMAQFAAGFETPVISLIGKSRASQWLPQGDPKKVIGLTHEEVCTGCNRESCRIKTIECMSSITAEDVKQSIDKLLKKK